jgi:CheY-like chemotaxis protein
VAAHLTQLGLFCRLAKALGGSLTVTNRGDAGVPGTSPTGVCFRLSLPLELPTPADRGSRALNDVLVQTAALRTPTPGPALGYHLLVVDDSATNRRIAERMLRSLGCTCTVVEDGDEVPDAVGRERFDVLLLDIRMARVNGDVACASLRADGYTGPIVAVTGNATRSDAEDYRRIGFTATLGKPFGAPEMRACLAEVAGGTPEVFAQPSPPLVMRAVLLT